MRKRKQRLVLVASAQPWRIARAVLELGDIIYQADPGVSVVPDENRPVIYVYSELDPERIYRLLTSEPPAYAERFVPVEILLRTRGVDVLAAAIARFVANRVGSGGVAWIEVHPRNYFLGSPSVSKILLHRLAEAIIGLGVVVARRGAQAWVVVEDTVEGVVAAVLPPRGDRASLWRKRRLGQIY